MSTKEIGRAIQKEGQRSEAKATQALEELKQEGVILDYRKANEEEDKNGVDFVLTLLDGQEKPLQVKSGRVGVTIHKEKHPRIPVVMVGGRPIEVLKREIKGRVPIPKKQLRF